MISRSAARQSCPTTAHHEDKLARKMTPLHMIKIPLGTADILDPDFFLCFTPRKVNLNIYTPSPSPSSSSHHNPSFKPSCSKKIQTTIPTHLCRKEQPSLGDKIMESQIVSRRVNMIAAHLAAHEDISTAPTHVFPVICSSNLNSVIRRCDNRMHFARQGSSSQGCFMRPSSYEQGNPSAIPPKSIGYANTASNASDTPMFSRPSSVEPSKKSVQQIAYVAQCYNYQYSECSPEAPKFARPCGTATEESRVQSRPRNYASETKGWSPKMDVAESRLNYMVMVELPGVNVSDIKVEVSDQNLMISGNRPTPWKVATYLCDSVSAYHKRDILQGPYQLAWPLPSNVNKDSVKAEFFDGLLRVIVPKLS